MRTSFRVEWDAIPAAVRSAIEDGLGSKVVEAVNQSGGYSPSLAARCRLADGRRVFLKAGADVPGMNGHVPVMLRRELELCPSWPAGFPAPRVQSTYDDRTWVAIAFEDVAGHTPAQPWRAEDLDRVIDALDDLPTPRGLPLLGAEHQLLGTFGGFAALVAEGRDEFSSMAAIEAGWTDAVRGDDLAHNDVRDDNVLLADDGRVLFVDWAHAGRGAGWLDVVFAAPSFELGGGPPCEETIRRSRRAAAADPEALTIVAVALLGFFTRQAALPPPPGVPAVRAFQEAQRRVTQRWVEQLLL